MRMEKKKGRTAPGINDQVHALGPSNRKSVSYRMTQETERKKSQASQICSAATISRADYSLWTKDFILRGTLAFYVGMETITSFPYRLVQLCIKQLLNFPIRISCSPVRCYMPFFFLQSEFLKCNNPDWESGERHPTAETALRHILIKNDKRKPQRLCDLYGYRRYIFC